MKNKIKIISITTTYPDSEDSPKAKFVHILNKGLTKLGMSITVITPHSKGSKKKQIMDNVIIKRFRYLPENHELNFSSIAEEVRRSQFGKAKIVFLTIGLFFSTILECIKNKPSLIHAHWAFPGGYIASIVSKILGIKYVVSIHGGEIPLLQKFRFLQKSVINSLNKSAYVIVNSSYSKTEFEKMGVGDDKIVQINPPPNFVKHNSDQENLDQFKRKFVKNDDSQIILFFGRLTERKGVQYLIKAIPEIKNKDVHLVIAGGGGYENYLKKITSSLKLNDKVTFFGRASDAELGYLHDIANVFVCPSIIDSQGETEGLGLVIPEAMESKIPVIGTSVGGIPDIIQHEVNGILVNEKDPVAIATAIERIFSDKSFKEMIVKNSQETVKEFLPDVLAKKHFDLFTNIVESKNSS